MRENYWITWSLILFNAAFALMNTVFFVGNLSAGKWTALFSLAAVIVNAWAAWFCYRSMRQRQQQEKDRVMGYLSGNIG
jgi:hypothetical protein